MFEENKEPAQDVSNNPLTEEMIEDIEHLIETYIPPFMDRYEDKLRDIVLYDSDDITSKEDLKKRIIKKLGIESLADPLFKFIMHSIRPKITPLLPQEETSKMAAFEKAKQTVAKLVDGAVEKINGKIELLLTPDTEESEKDQVSIVEMDDDALVAEVIGEYVEIVDDSPEEVPELEVEDQIEEYPPVVTGTVDLPAEETLKPEPVDYDKLKELLIERMLMKHSHKIEEKFPDLLDQNKAKEVFRKRIESVVEETLARKKK